MKYTISKLQEFDKFIKVQFQYAPESAKDTLVFPDWRPGRYELGNFVKNLKSFKIEQNGNDSINVKKTERNKWLLTNISTTEPITVTYFYYANELNAGSTWVDESQIYVNPVNCCIYPEGKESEPCTLTIECPESYTMAGAISDSGTTEMESIHTLMDTPFIASKNIVHHSFEVKKTLFHVWLQGEQKIDLEKLEKDFIKFTKLQIEQFGGFPVKEYHYLFHILPYKHYHGVEHQTSTVITLGPSFALNKEFYKELLGVSSHELYHTWNVKYLRPIDWYPYDYSKENYSTLGFIAEGVTTYMGDLCLLQSKTLDWDWFFEQYQVWLNRHFDNFGRFNESVGTSGFNTWVDGYVPGIPGKKVSIYNEGALLASCLDILIIHHSHRKCSLHTLMANLYKIVKDSPQGITKELYQKEAEKLTGTDLSWFFDDYVYGTSAYEVLFKRVFEHIGIELKKKARKKRSEGLFGFKSDSNNKITSIYPASELDVIGVQTGDVITTINDIKVGKDLEHWLEYFEYDIIRFGVMRNNVFLQFELPSMKRVYYSDYYFEPINLTPNESKYNFRAWSTMKYEDVFKES